jgi:hypothetical protein
MYTPHYVWFHKLAPLRKQNVGVDRAESLLCREICEGDKTDGIYWLVDGV